MSAAEAGRVALPSLRDGFRTWVFGAQGGLGAAFVQHLLADPRCAAIHAGARSPGPAPGKVAPFRFDLEDEASIAAAVAEAAAAGEPDLVVVTTGFLHGAGVTPEKSLRAISADTLAKAYALNAIGPALIAKHVLPLLPRDRKSVFAALSARVGSVSDNHTGGWHAYRASKAALNMVIRNAAIEVALRNKKAVCLALHPGTVDTALSAPFQAGVAPGKLFSPLQSAAHLLAVVEGATPSQTGLLITWDGQVIPF